MWYDRQKEIFSDEEQGMISVGKEGINREELEKFLALEKKIGLADFLFDRKDYIDDQHDLRDIQHDLLDIAEVEIQFDHVRMVDCFNTDESIGVFYSLKEEWIVMIGEDGIFTRGERSVSCKCIEKNSLLWQGEGDKEEGIGREQYDKYGFFPPSLKNQAMWENIK